MMQNHNHFTDFNKNARNSPSIIFDLVGVVYIRSKMNYINDVYKMIYVVVQ